MIIDFGLKSLVHANRHLRLGSTILLPQSLSAVTTINNEEEVSAESVGMNQDGVEAIWKSVEEIYKTATHPAISLCFRRQGKIILSRSIGYANGHKPNQKPAPDARLMQPDTPICYFSGSKAVTAFLVHLLNEDKLIDLKDPVSAHLPEFGQHGKQDITIHQVLSHRSGMSAMPSSLGINALGDNEEIWQQLCAKQLPNTKTAKLAYHAISGGYILERIINQVTGMSIQAFLDLRIRKPMNMQYFSYGLPNSQVNDLADHYATGIKARYPISYCIKRALGTSFEQIAEVSNTAMFQQAVIPSANLMGTAEEMSRFYQMLLNQGVWQGKQICHIGLINKLLWADPERDIAVSLINTGLPLLANNVPSLVNFMASINKHCPR